MPGYIQPSASLCRRRLRQHTKGEKVQPIDAVALHGYGAERLAYVLQGPRRDGYVHMYYYT